MNLTLKTFNQIYSLMNDEDAVLVYAGEFDQEIIKSMLNYAEDKMEYSGINGSTRRKLFNVMVEMLQNIVKHQIPHELETKAIFILVEKKDEFQLITGNPVPSSLIDNIKSKIIAINKLDISELKAFYKETRLSSRISGAGGAGLGFIDMSRKSGNKLDSDYYNTESELHKYFVLKTRIDKNN